MKIVMIRDLMDVANHSYYFKDEILEVDKIDDVWYRHQYIQNGELFIDSIIPYYCEEVD